MFRNTVIVLALAIAAPASAQRVLYDVSDGNTRTTAFLDLVTGQSTRIGADLSGRAVFTSDGQYVIRTVSLGSTTETRLRHVASGLETTLAVAFTPQVAHPRALVVFGTVGSVLTRLDAAGLRQWSPCGSGVTAPFQLSDDGTRLFTVCPDGHFLVLDSESGAVLRDTVISAAGAIVSFASSPDGSQVVVVRRLSLGVELARLDAVTGDTLRVRAFSNPLVMDGRLCVVPGGTRFIEAEFVMAAPGTTGWYPRLVEFDSLDRLPGFAARNSIFPPDLVIASDGRQAFVSWWGSFGGGQTASVEQFDLASGARLASASAVAIAVVAVAPRPHAPVAVAVEITGRSVALSWQLPALSPAATGYRLAIGSATGTSNLGAIAIGPGESFTAANVPPGRYFVRLHTVNFTGESPASAEVIIDVP